MRENVKAVAAGLMVLVMAGCAGTAATQGATGGGNDPDARDFKGTIISLRAPTSTMLISKDEHHGRDAFPNIIQVRYDANTKFFLDGQPATLMDISQYMTVQVAGHMREGEMVAETAKFSSVLPMNVKPAPAGK